MALIRLLRICALLAGKCGPPVLVVEDEDGKNCPLPGVRGDRAGVRGVEKSRARAQGSSASARGTGRLTVIRRHLFTQARRSRILGSSVALRRSCSVAPLGCCTTAVASISFTVERHFNREGPERPGPKRLPRAPVAAGRSSILGPVRTLGLVTGPLAR